MSDLPKGRAFTRKKADHPEGKVHKATDELVIAGKATEGKVIQVTTYTLAKGKEKGTYQSGKVESMKMDLDDPKSRIYWLKADLNSDHKAEIKLTKKRQSLTNICKKAKALCKAMENASKGNKPLIEADPAFEGDIGKMLDFLELMYNQGKDAMLNVKQQAAGIPLF